MNNPNENQAIDINNARISNVTEPSNANNLINDRNSQNLFNWCEEDGEFEFDDEFPRIVRNQTEVVQQGGDHHESQPPLQSAQLELVDNDSDFNFEGDGIIGSRQISSSIINNDQVTTTITTDKNVIEGQKQNDEEEVGSSQPSPINQDTFQNLDDLMTDEIGKINHGNLCTAQNNEVPVQSVLIDQKDVVTLEDVITKSQSPEKVLKSKQTPQRGRQRKSAKKTRVDAEIMISAAENTKSSPFKYKNDQADQNEYLSASENDPKTKSGRKVQRPEYFNPTIFGYRKKLALESKDFVINTSKKTYKKTGKRRTKHKLKNANFPLSENNPEISSEDKQMYAVDASTNSQDLIPLQTSNGSILYDPNDPSTIYVDPEDDNIVCVFCCDGTSEKHNWIVFCDKCDAPYHQRCHKPTIEDNVAEDSHSEWICSNCKNMPRLSKRIKVDKKNHEIHEIYEDKEKLREVTKPLPIGAVLTREQKVEYLSSLSQDVLVNLLLLAEQMEPNIPLYPANILRKYTTSNMLSSNIETDDTNRSPQDTGELVVDAPSSGLSTAEVSNLSTLDISTNLNPENIEPAPQNNSDQDAQQEPITPDSEPSLPSSSLKEITEHSKDSYLNLYIKAMSEIGNPNGSTAQTMHAWIKSNYNVPENFSARAKKSLHYAVHKGIFIKNSRMTYKFNPDYIKAVNINDHTTATPTQNAGINVNENDGTSYKELTAGLQNDGETPGIEKRNSLAEIKDFNFYTNQEFFLDSILDANLLGKGEDTYTPSTSSSLTNTDNHNAENDNNVSITDQYNQTSASPEKQPAQSISRIQKLSVNTPMMMNNEQTRSDIRLPPLAPKPSIDVLPSIIRSSPVHYQPSQQITNRQNELISSSIGGNNYFSYSIIQPPQVLPKKRILPLPQVNNNHNTTKIRPSSPNYSILMPTVIRGGNQLSQQPHQMYDHTKIRAPSSSIPSLQSLPTIHNSTTMPPSPLQQHTLQQAWPASFNSFYMAPQTSDNQYTTLFDNTFYDPTPQPSQQHHQQHNNVVNDLHQQQQHHNENNSLFNRIGGQQDNLGTSRSSLSM
ncbi:5051_t:CDS:2 [Funneliformis caledonium]|uniref:Histone H1 n=1 Tax=Funneliformis caledonium TaxID=1117310 RepID=A0A9N8VUK9_9GLOM|nr:5051_t:CDS:2 [Funneliformis caledonium]